MVAWLASCSQRPHLGLIRRAPVSLSPNKEEVDGVRYVTQKELQVRFLELQQLSVLACGIQCCFKAP